MAKITLDDITSSYASTSLFQSNFTAIETEFNGKVLYRDNPTGEANQMENDLDMNSNDILNGGTINTNILKIGGTQVVPTGTTELPALNVDYDNTTSGLTASNVQDAIDEVDADLDTAEATIVTNTANIATNTAYIANGNNHGRNLVINGDFSVWQRGTSQSSGGYGADRWRVNASGGTITGDQRTFTLGQTDVPGNPKYYFDYDVTTSSDFTRLEHRIENVITASGQEVTLSFYAKGTNPGSGAVDLVLEQFFGTGGSPSTSVQTTIDTTTLTASWQRFTYTFTIPSVTGKTLGTDGNDYLGIFIGQHTDTSTDAWQLEIVNVQLEPGDTATDFEYVSPADQLARCQRYFERLSETEQAQICSGYSDSTILTQNTLNYTYKRAIPSITISDVTGFSITRAGATIATTAMSAVFRSNTRCRLEATVASGLTAGEGCAVFMPTGEYVDIDAEL